MINPWKFAIIVICIIVIIIIARMKWLEFRFDWYKFQYTFHVRLPFWSHVTLTREGDGIRWGRKRYRFVRQDGMRDRRRAFNIKIKYPTILICQSYKVYLFDYEYAKHLYYRMQDYMRIPLGDCTFDGDVRGDLYKHFRGRRIRFVRHIGKLFFRYGWYGDIIYNKNYDLLIQHNGYYYAVICLFTQQKIGTMIMHKVPVMMDGVKTVLVTCSTFTPSAIEYAKERGWLLMDRPHIDLCFDADCIAFIGREG